jgi:hypothetical protein
MYVIAHQHVSMNQALRVDGAAFQQVEIHEVVRVAEKTSRAVVAALNDMERDFCQYWTGTTGHDGPVSGERSSR